MLAGPNGFPYHTICYTGKSETTSSELLGSRVVNSLLDSVKPSTNILSHHIFFDNFFTSYALLSSLSESGCKATGTIRQSRTGGANKELMSDKDLKKMPRGSYDYRCDGKVYVVKWKGSAIVCLASNCVNHEPEQVAQRRVGRVIEKVKQPMVE